MVQTRLDDYSATAGSTRDWAVDTNYDRDGDPVKAAKIIADLAS